MAPHRASARRPPDLGSTSRRDQGTCATSSMIWKPLGSNGSWKAQTGKSSNALSARFGGQDPTGGFAENANAAGRGRAEESQ
jgi:hypothetical protein